MNVEELKQKALAGPVERQVLNACGEWLRCDTKEAAYWAARGLKIRDLYDFDYATILAMIAERDELLAALKSYRVARAMPSYGDYASIQWESQQGPTNPQWGGGDCNKHGRWYGHCHCCANDWDKLKKQADQDAVHARDNALRKADSLAVEAISKVEG